MCVCVCAYNKGELTDFINHVCVCVFCIVLVECMCVCVSVPLDGHTLVCAGRRLLNLRHARDVTRAQKDHLLAAIEMLNVGIPPVSTSYTNTHIPFESQTTCVDRNHIKHALGLVTKPNCVVASNLCILSVRLRIYVYVSIDQIDRY